MAVRVKKFGTFFLVLAMLIGIGTYTWQIDVPVSGTYSTRGTEASCKTVLEMYSKVWLTATRLCSCRIKNSPS